MHAIAFQNSTVQILQLLPFLDYFKSKCFHGFLSTFEPSTHQECQQNFLFFTIDSERLITANAVRISWIWHCYGNLLLMNINEATLGPYAAKTLYLELFLFFIGKRMNKITEKKNIGFKWDFGARKKLGIFYSVYGHLSNAIPINGIDKGGVFFLLFYAIHMRWCESE